jgi:uncharacterized membrane protein
MAETVARRSERPIAIARHPIYSMLLPVPVVCFIGALITDLCYQGSGGNLIWVNFSSWLIAAGLFFGAIAGVVLLIDLIRGAARGTGLGWWHFGLLLAAWIVELINSFVHARDGWTAVVPDGLVLSIVAVLLVLVSGWLWQSIRYRSEEVRP